MSGSDAPVRVLLVAAARDMVAGALAAVERAGLHPAAVDLTSFAVLRSLVTTGSGLGSTQAEALAGEAKFDAFTRGRYANDASIYQIMPAGVVISRPLLSAR